MTTPEIISLILKCIIAFLMGTFTGVSIVVFKRTLDIERKLNTLYDIIYKYDEIATRILNHIHEVINLNKEVINRNKELTDGLKSIVDSYNKLLDYNKNYLKFIKSNMIRRKTPIED